MPTPSKPAVKWTIATRPNSPLVTLDVTRLCGHTEGLVYGGRRFAEADAARQADKLCIACDNTNRIKILSFR